MPVWYRSEWLPRDLNLLLVTCKRGCHIVDKRECHQCPYLHTGTPTSATRPRQKSTSSSSSSSSSSSTLLTAHLKAAAVDVGIGSRLTAHLEAAAADVGISEIHTLGYLERKKDKELSSCLSSSAEASRRCLERCFLSQVF